MRQSLILLGLIVVAIGVLWPWLGRIGLGRLPGDIYIPGEHVSFYFPLATCALISVVISVALWLVNR